MPYQIAGIDVHKKMLAVVVADVELEGEYQFERQKVGTSLRLLSAGMLHPASGAVNSPGRHHGIHTRKSRGGANRHARS